MLSNILNFVIIVIITLMFALMMFLPKQPPRWLQVVGLVFCAVFWFLVIVISLGVLLK